MAGSRGNERKCPRRLKKDSRVCLSDLPDDILLQILSFLPTKSAVATSLLSRRWEYLWTSTPNLQLDESGFNDRDQFMTFSERALLLRVGSSMVSFSLSCSLKKDASRINTWITSAIRYNVEQLSLNLRADGPSLFLPLCLFGCKSLIKLELDMVSVHRSTIRVPSMICLPRLKHLAVKWVQFVDNESTEKFLSHPSLEELIITCCTWGNVSAVNVNSPILQSLTIDYDDDWSKERQVCFIGGNLRFFGYKGGFPPNHYSICGSTMQLREAKISLHIPEVLDMDGPSNDYCKLVNSLSMVQTLTLSGDALHSLYQLSQSPRLQSRFPVFERMTRLNLSDYCNRTTISIDYEWLRMIFKRCPHLEHLNFMQAVVFYSSTGDLPHLKPMPSCFNTHLKKITIQWYDPKCGKQAGAIHVLLNSAPVLEEMLLHCKRDVLISDEDAKVAELEREFNTCPKVSENCRVSIVLV